MSDKLQPIGHTFYYYYPPGQPYYAPIRILYKVIGHTNVMIHDREVVSESLEPIKAEIFKVKAIKINMPTMKEESGNFIVDRGQDIYEDGVWEDIKKYEHS
jgi:hypothetical protein